jgi:excinuclease ABC subunit B
MQEGRIEDVSIFELKAPYKPAGDQPKAIEQLTSGITQGLKDQTLLGVTGSGKTFTIANVIAAFDRPVLVISHNKTLAAQLYNEFRTFFPKNAVHYFVSYYDYYQPEAYVPTTDTYIEKETDINEEIDRLRQAATHSLLTRRDVIIVASVSCIYGIGNPATYQETIVPVEVGGIINRKELFRHLIGIQYERNDIDFARGRFRVRGDVIEIFPAYEEFTIRLELFGQRLEKITELDSLTGQVLSRPQEIVIFPTRHFVTPHNTTEIALKEIEEDLLSEVEKFRKEGKFLEAERLDQRTRFDLEMIRETGYCNGIENYSRYFDRRLPGEPPYTLLDYFNQSYGGNPQIVTDKSPGGSQVASRDWLLIIDESHMTIPQLGGMYEGDRSRKEVLVQYGFRLPAALDNRPLKFAEFRERQGQTIYMSATPTEYERKISSQIVEQIVRPTGLVDPKVEVRETHGQIANLIEEIKRRVEKGQRVLITTLTKRMAEDLTDHLLLQNIKVQYLHSDIETLERTGILHDLRAGVYDVVVGINLLREGLDLPEVSLVVILDADKEGFLRSDVALIQTFGRAARHIEGMAVMYADNETSSMKRAVNETERRRKVQLAFNKRYGITPKTIHKGLMEYLKIEKETEKEAVEKLPSVAEIPLSEIPRLIKELERQMDLAARNLEFEKAAALRDKIRELRTGNGE